MKAEIGVIGLGTMGANLARNILSKGFKTAVFNRTYLKTEEFLKNYGNKNLIGSETLEDFINNLEKPRKMILLIPAGSPVDEMVTHLKTLLDRGDLIIDGGNSFFEDTDRRQKDLEEDGINYLGMGISGGEEGALHGPSLMPGGNLESYQSVKEILQAIAAKDFNGEPCVTYVGKGAAGHFVKMVHNGIEYAIMQLLAESYDLMRKINQIGNNEMAEIFKKWNEGVLNSYLLEISSRVLKEKDNQGEGFLLDKIKDQAGQKGTGNWTAIEGFKKGVALPQISSAVQARVISSQKKLRILLSQNYNLKSSSQLGELVELESLEQALYATIVLAYLEGFALIKTANEENDWKIRTGEICRIWEGGCIIRSTLLAELKQIFKTNPELDDLLQSKEINEILVPKIDQLKIIIRVGIKFGIAVPCFSSGFNFLAGITDESTPANLIQGLRDLFGAHTYERLDKDGIFHTNWK